MSRSKILGTQNGIYKQAAKKINFVVSFPKGKPIFKKNFQKSFVCFQGIMSENY